MNKFIRKLKKLYCITVYKFNPEKYKKIYPKYLNSVGVNISPDHYKSGHGFISPSVTFDGNDFSLITIGESTTISSDVVLLTHDYSISKGLKLIDPNLSGRFLKPITIGKNCFIGMRTMILPGTQIGDNVIVGAASVVKGTFPDNVVIAGNPARIVYDNVEEWARKHYEAGDYNEL